MISTHRINVNVIEDELNVPEDEIVKCAISHLMGISKNCYVGVDDFEPTQKQRDTTFDWCHAHGAKFPHWLSNEP